MQRCEWTTAALAMAAVGLMACGDNAASVARDSGPADSAQRDATLPDAGSSDLGSADGGGDGPLAECGNGILEPGEDCDGSDLGDATCVGLGLPDGTLACTDACTLDTLGCAVCGDGICSPGESATGCPADCAVMAVSAGEVHTCAVLANGSVRCWGGRDGHRMGGAPDLNEPVEVPGIAGATAVAAGASHTCAVTAGGEVYCWGRNGYGEVGTGETSREVFPPQKVEGLPAATAVQAGRNHTCAITTNGQVWCWGRDDYGQVGIWFVHAQPTPERAGSLTGATVLAAGDYHTCALAGTTVQCWGGNDQGQVGLSDTRWRSAPAVTATKALAVGAGARHTCATIFDPAAPAQFSGTFCFGSNAYGQLGSPPTTDVLAPQRVTAIRGDVIVGGRAFTCAFGGTTSVPMCWGRNDFGQLGDGTQNLRYTPGPVTGLEGGVALTAGAEHACALLDDGTLRCWGRNQRGQLGDGSNAAFQTTPVEPVRL